MFGCRPSPQPTPPPPHYGFFRPAQGKTLLPIRVTLRRNRTNYSTWFLLSQVPTPVFAGTVPSWYDGFLSIYVCLSPRHCSEDHAMVGMKSGGIFPCQLPVGTRHDNSYHGRSFVLVGVTNVVLYLLHTAAEDLLCPHGECTNDKSTSMHPSSCLGAYSPSFPYFPRFNESDSLSSWLASRWTSLHRRDFPGLLGAAVAASSCSGTGR